MSSLFSRLQLNTNLVSDQIQPNNEAVTKHLSALPPLLPDWAQTDMKNSQVGGYYSNPVVNVINTITGYCNNIMAVPGASVAGNCVTVFNAANTLVHSTSNYIAHTNRLSGVTPINQNTVNLPHLDTAINSGKMLTMLTYQIDGIQNNAPMVGFFSSLYTVNSFSNIANTIITYAGEIQNSINVSTYTDELTGNTYTTYTSNLSSSRAGSMSSQLNTVTSEMATRRTSDETYYTNSQQIITEYGSLKKFNNLGATETNMFNNLVGTDKLKSRINP